MEMLDGLGIEGFITDVFSAPSPLPSNFFHGFVRLKFGVADGATHCRYSQNSSSRIHYLIVVIFSTCVKNFDVF